MLLSPPEMRLRLKEWRQRRAMTQDELASTSGVARTTIMRLEANESEARPSTVRKLATALKVDTMDLVIPDTD